MADEVGFGSQQNCDRTSPATAENSIVVVSEANATLSPDSVTEAAEAVAEAAVVLARSAAGSSSQSCAAVEGDLRAQPRAGPSARHGTPGARPM